MLNLLGFWIMINQKRENDLLEVFQIIRNNLKVQGFEVWKNTAFSVRCTGMDTLVKIIIFLKVASSSSKLPTVTS